jgi:NAD(P)-dependent dehydrogenase (short-subunit alcohol dehydrogenase family)
MNVLIIGKSALATAVEPLLDQHQVTIVGRPEYNLKSQYGCSQLVLDHNPDCVVLTQGIMDENVWNNLTVNATSAIYLISEFYKKMNNGQIIAVSSASVNWQSWPGKSITQLVYATAKTSLSQFCSYMNRKNMPEEHEKDISIQVYEPQNFPSKIAPNSKQDIQIVAEELKILIDNPRISVLQGLNR